MIMEQDLISKQSSFILQEGGKIVQGIRANTKIEKGIVDVINTEKTNLLRFSNVIRKIVKYFDLQGIAEHTGNKSGTINQKYKDYSKKFQKKINKTCKTDFKINDDKISLKLNSGWIFGGILEEYNICLMSVLDTLDNEELQKTLRNTFENILNEIKSMKYIVDNKVIKNKISAKFIKFYEDKETHIKREFIRQALTGSFKFEKNDIGIADKLMVVKFRTTNLTTTKAFQNVNNINFNKSKIYDLWKDDYYLDKIIENSRISLRTKDKKLHVDLNSYNLDGDMLNECNYYLTESFWNDLQNAVKKGYEFFKNKFIEFYNFLIKLMKKGIIYLLNFLGIEIDIDFQDEIIFP